MSEPSEDPYPAIQEECMHSHHCSSLKDILDKCTARVESVESTEETCVEEFFDLMECINHCSAPKLASKLK